MGRGGSEKQGPEAGAGSSTGGRSRGAGARRRLRGRRGSEPSELPPSPSPPNHLWLEPVTSARLLDTQAIITVFEVQIEDERQSVDVIHYCYWCSIKGSSCPPPALYALPFPPHLPPIAQERPCARLLLLHPFLIHDLRIISLSLSSS